MKKIIISILTITYILFGTIYAFYDDEATIEDLYIESISRDIVPSISSKSALLYDVTYDRILYEKNPNERRAMASTTKMITAIVAYDRGNLEEVVTVSKKAASTGGSSIDLKAGDKISLDDLIKGLLVHSGNDAAVCIAEHIGGSVENFSNLMNEKAEEIGAKNTHFVTPHGLDAEEHFSTAYDLVLIAKRLLEIPYLANIVASKEARLNVNGTPRVFRTTNEMLSIFEGANGVKTGFTGDAGRCLITSITKDDRKLISVVLGADTKKMRTLDSVNLLNYGLKAYKILDISHLLKNKINIYVAKSDAGNYMLSKDINLTYLLKENEINNVEVKYEVVEDLVAPLYKGTKVSEAKIYLNSELIGTVQYKLPHDILRKSWKSYFREFTKEFINVQ